MRRRSTPTLTTLAALIALAGCAANPPAKTTATATTASHACPAWTNPPAPASIAPPAQQTTAALAQYAAQELLQTPRPILNPYATSLNPLAQRAAPFPCLVRTTPRNEKVGQRTAFWTYDADNNSENQVMAQLVYVTPHLYMYVQDGSNVDVTAIKASADRFESQILPTDERTYGTHWSPGVDDDPHITVLNATGLGKYIGGYFSATDEFPHLVYPYSNERQMIYINLDGGEVPGDAFYNATLAHEFQHMIHWYYHPADDSWINEGMSVLAQHLNGFTSNGYENDFLAHPETQLTTWSNDGTKVRANYGAGYLFMDYLAEHYGGYSILKTLLTDPAQVPLNINDALQASGSSDHFDDVFTKWVIANLLNNPAVANGIYAYPTIPGVGAVPQQFVRSYPYATGQTAVNQYGTEYYRFDGASGGTGTLSVSFAGTPYTTIVNNQPYGGARYEWWSNAGDNVDTTLTHTFDLSHVTGQRVTMSFDAWYDLSGAAAQVEVSGDGGKTWSVPTVDIATGGNICCGFSDHSGTGSAAGWEPDSINLTPYAGKTIQVRFEVAEQSHIHPQGLTLDNFAIPAIGFTDDVSSDNGWHAAGFVRVPNILPQTYIVQAVIYPAGGGTPQVRRIAVDAATATASATFAGFGGTIDRVTLAVSATAPSILTPAPFQLSAQLT
jgi:hypothetical protein